MARQALVDKMIEVCDELGDIGYEILSEQLRYAADDIEAKDEEEFDV
ncbi:hypothetical protein SEA_CAFASSO_143 [Gordonia phage Cafasso]|uniref:Uncharacterized protein n=1 Tax=Gordonia phage Cafasso TaxID=2851095 RepID=A0AAE7VCH7_9CAUD|nr:hypothetical protein SEA_CAFASSO_143 [Gordonia phage Cafasso]